MWQGDKKSCDNLANNPPGSLNPLSCGESHLRNYGATGYDSDGHWCKIGKQTLRLQSQYKKK